MIFKFKVLMLTSDVMLKPPHKISNEKTLNYDIFPRHTLPNLDLISAISEVIILNNDQNNIKKQYQQTKGLIQRSINISHLLSIGVIVAEKFCFEKVFVCCLQVSLAWKKFLARQKRGIE